MNTVDTLPSSPSAPLAEHDAERDWQAVASILKALSDPVRLTLFAAIADAGEPVCVCNLPDLGVSQPTVSHHLRKLRAADLIDCERRSTWVYYWPTPLGRRAVTAVAGLGAERGDVDTAAPPFGIAETADSCDPTGQTAYLTRSPANARRILDAVERLEGGGGSTHDLIDAD